MLDAEVSPILRKAAQYNNAREASIVEKDLAASKEQRFSLHNEKNARKQIVARKSILLQHDKK